MCLNSSCLPYDRDRIRRTIERHSVNKHLRIGYKLFTTDGEQLFLAYQSNNQPLKKKRWLHEKQFRNEYTKNTIIDSQLRPYRVGFHIFIDPKDASSFAYHWWNSIARHMNNGIRVCKLYFDDVTRYGLQSGRVVVVAKKIYIPEHYYIETVKQGYGN
jgi:hypothetical protein